MSRARWCDDEGQAVPLFAAILVLALALALGVAGLGRLIVDAGRARTAADAAALAGVEGGAAASARLAAEHGATLVSWTSSGSPDQRTVTVTVRVGRSVASAAASNRTTAGPGNQARPRGPPG